jgi:glycerophosphoryl diester phosphodiesterase
MVHIKKIGVSTVAALAAVSLVSCSSGAEASEEAAPSTTTAATTAAEPAAQSPQRISAQFDLQAHRGGRALTTENTPEAFAAALELGVSTLELDTQVTADGVAVVTHDRKMPDNRCQDTGPVTPNDPAYPYVGKYIVNLTLEQVQSVDCGTMALDSFPDQNRIAGAPIPTLKAVLEAVAAYDAPGVMLNVETKVEAGAPEETAPQGIFVKTVLDTIAEAGFLDRITIQSFDWGALMEAGKLYPDVPLVALMNLDFLQTGQEGASPWLGGIDIDDFGGDPIAAIASFGASAYSPVQGNPQEGKLGDPGFQLNVTPELIESAHAAGIQVIPWTVNDGPTMAALIDLGVDGIITDDPALLRSVLAEKGIEAPRAVAKK